MKATIEDVARLAGVATSTVTRALQDSPRISQATKARVRAVVAQLGYRPNTAAAELRIRKSWVIGIIISDNANPVLADIVRGATAVARRLGYHVILCNSDNLPEVESEHVSTLLSRQVEGLIVSVAREQGPHLDRLRRLETPLVFVNRQPEIAERACIAADNEAATRLATLHLMHVGHRRIGFLHGDLRFSTGRERLAGYRLAHRQRGLPVDESLIIAGNFDSETTFRAALELLARPDRPTALMSSDIYSTLGMMRAVQARGLAVPGDLSLIGYDNHPWTELLSPPLSVVAQPTEQMGVAAAVALFAQIDGAKAGNGPREAPAIAEYLQRLPCRFVERHSIAPPPSHRD
ncbi:MAG TPA: LacI family DNA-binding transcriptional regulator [Limnochordia bacterium]|nr:LacI family DNA-binding transcriptional regulator [Limnochordia bacterium]